MTTDGKVDFGARRSSGVAAQPLGAICGGDLRAPLRAEDLQTFATVQASSAGAGVLADARTGRGREIRLLQAEAGCGRGSRRFPAQRARRVAARIAWVGSCIAV